MHNSNFFQKLCLLASLLFTLSAGAQNGTGYFIRFPDDVYTSDYVYGGGFGEPLVLADTAVSIIGLNYEDQIETVIVDACFRITRTWTIVNWYNYDPNLPCIQVPNPTPSALLNDPINWPGPVVSAPGTPSPWSPSSIKVLPTDPNPTDYSTFWSQTPNCYQYTQTIKIIDNEPPVAICPPLPLAFSDATTNDAAFWNAPAWTNPNTGSHDLKEGEALLSIAANDATMGGQVTVNYVLFLDLDSDGVMETVVSSNTPQTPGVVNFNNASTPGFLGGEPSLFDQRSVPAGDKYKFALQESILPGPAPQRTSTLRWVSASAPGQFSPVQLPHGTHKIKWIISDGCGNEQVCERLFTVTDDLLLTFSGIGFLDQNANCAFNPASEIGLSDKSITAVAYPSLKTSPGITLAQGLYNMYAGVAATDTAVLLRIEGGGPFSPCPVWVSLVPGATAYEKDLPVSLLGDCPRLHVDIATPRLRRCFENNFSVSYYNTSTVAAPGAYVEVTFDNLLEVLSATIPYTQAGDTYRFELGTLSGGAMGSFGVLTKLSCEAPLGQTHCATAHIFPDSLCEPASPTWSGAWVEARAWCDGDSVRLSLKNRGTGNMQQMLEFIVIEDVILYRSDNFQLPAGDSLLLTMGADGSTWHISAQQEPGFPFPDLPSATLEACGGLNIPGLGGSFPNNDAAHFIDIFCLQNTGSFDPNDKTAFPTGYGNEHFVRPNTDLEYLIRFQNTGTDTAFRVVVVDTLSEKLDWATLEAGTSSHPYRLDVLPGGALHFVFENILLPDSNANEAASHGFVKFRIAQKPDLQDDTRIENRASIYFDFNDAVVTNTVFHTVGTNFIEVVSAQEPSGANLFSVKTSPNPFADRTVFTFDGPPIGAAQFQLTDAQGRLAATRSFSGNRFVFEQPGLAPGLYFFRVTTGEQVLVFGKLQKG